MMTLKDKGNEEFKKNNLQKAIEYYSQYVEQGHKDNQFAFSNIAMCYFKQKNYVKTIQACQRALQEKKQFPKAYYRLYLTYKELPDQQYQVFINAYFFLKYFTEENQNAKAEALAIMRQYKNKFINKKKIEKINPFEEDILNDFSSLELDSNSKIIEQPSSIFEWEQYLQNNKIDIRQRWQKIQEIGNKQFSFTINLAYLLLNKCSAQQDKNFIKQKISQIKKKQLHIQTVQPKIEKIETHQQGHKMSFEESEENLFESESEKVEGNKPIKIEQNNDEQTKQKQSIPLKLDDNKIVQEKVDKEEQAEFEFKRNEYVSSPQQITSQIDLFMKQTQKSRDIFKDINQFVIKLLKSNRSIQSKKKYLLQLHKKCNQTKFIKNSLSVKDQKQIYTLLVRNRLEQLYQIYAPKAK